MPEIPTRPHLLEATRHWSAHGCGGANRVVAAKREVLAGSGWRYTLLAPGAGSDGVGDSGTIDSGGVRLAGHLAVSVPRIVRLIEDARPDIIETADSGAIGSAVLEAAARLDVPAVVSCRGPAAAALVPPLPGRRASAWPQWLRRQRAHALARRLAAFDLVLAPSRGIVRALHDLGVAQAQHQPLGVDTARFSPAAGDVRWRHRFEQQIEVAAGTRLVIYTGCFTPAKNLDVLVRAVGMLGARHCLLAVGDGPTPPRGAHVRVLPPLRDPRALARLLASSDVFVHAGEHETFGLAALEAMACGTPVVASAAGGLGELVDGAGIAVPGLNPARWAEAIAATLADPRSALAWAALARARALDWSLVLAHLTARLRRAMRERARAQGGVSSPSAAYSLSRL